MIEGIGEVTAQQMTRGDQQAVVAGQEKAQREINQAAAKRPVEKPADSPEAKTEDQDQGRYNLEHKVPVYEKYGPHGELLLQLPPVHADEA